LKEGVEEKAKGLERDIESLSIQKEYQRSVSSIKKDQSVKKGERLDKNEK
jgi:hypothetical protein